MGTLLLKSGGPRTSTTNKSRKKRSRKKNSTAKATEVGENVAGNVQNGNGQPEKERTSGLSEPVVAPQITGSAKGVDHSTEMFQNGLQNGSSIFTTTGLEAPLPQTEKRTVPMSPRKQTLMRHKKSDDELKRESFILDAKGNLRTRSMETDVSEALQLPKDPVALNITEKVTLFNFPSAKVVLYHEIADGSQAGPKQGGTLLGHGSFEVFQLHKGDVTYLSCGPSFVYPLLPKVKILRTSFNQFVLPLANPERYWRISLDTNDSAVIKQLEQNLEVKVQYRNFHMNDALREYSGKSQSSHSTLPYPTTTTPPYSQPFLPIAHEIPESPPSAPISPQQMVYRDTIQTNATPVATPRSPLGHIVRKKSSQSITSAMASFDVSTNDHPYRNPYQLEQPKPRRHDMGLALPRFDMQKFNKPANDRKSESSMDSLLDEFEENISITKSITFSAKPESHISRAPSRQSISSAVSRARLALPKQDDHDYSADHNKMSRRSSRSELYTSETNWMEPNAPMDSSRLPRSRSTYSVASSHYNRNVKGADLNNTYHNIYRSITQRNLSQYSGSGDKPDTRHLRSFERAGSERSFTESVKLAQSRRSAVPSANSQLRESGRYFGDYRPAGEKDRENLRDERLSSKLNSTELYNMIRAKRESSKNTAPKRFFGWG